MEIISHFLITKANFTDKQRGDGTFNKSIVAMKLLNDLGYGKENSDLILNLVLQSNWLFFPQSKQVWKWL